jgi:phosphoglycolate phosphatase
MTTPCNLGTRHDLLLFDLDGTLSDPLVGIGRSLNYALAHFGYTELELAACSTYIGPPLDQTFTTLTGTTSPQHVAELIAKYRERYADVGYAENVLYPGIPAALARLSEAGVPLAVCTAKPHVFAVRILALFGLQGYFRFVDGGQVGLHKWQQIEALLAQGAVTTASVMIGDRAVDLVTAHRNGLQAAGVLWGHGSRQELEAERPRYLFHAPPELPTLALGTNATEP